MLGSSGGKKPAGHVAPGKPTQKGFVERLGYARLGLNGRMRDELLNETLFFTIGQACTILARWVHHYNIERPHSSLGYATRKATGGFKPAPCFTIAQTSRVQSCDTTHASIFKTLYCHQLGILTPPPTASPDGVDSCNDLALAMDEPVQSPIEISLTQATTNWTKSKHLEATSGGIFKE